MVQIALDQTGNESMSRTLAHIQKMMTELYVASGATGQIALDPTGNESFHRVLDHIQRNFVVLYARLGASGQIMLDTTGNESLPRVFSHIQGNLTTLYQATLGAYRAKAVYFDGNNYLLRQYMNSTVYPGDPLFPTSPVGAYSVWFKAAAFSPSTEFLVSYRTFHGQKIISWNDSQSYLNPLLTALEIVPYVYCMGLGSELTLQAGRWYHQAASWNTDFAVGSKIFQIFLSGVDLGATQTGDTSGGPSPAQWSYSDGTEGVTIVIPDIPDNGVLPVSLADFQFWNGVFIDWSNPANLARVFLGGKPVAPSSALGQQTLLFSGNKSTFGVNQGAGGAYSLARSVPFAGRVGAGLISLPGAVAGDPVHAVTQTSPGLFAESSPPFESTISISNQIQQTSAGNLSSGTFVANLPGALTDDDTSPSD